MMPNRLWERGRAAILVLAVTTVAIVAGLAAANLRDATLAPQGSGIKAPGIMSTSDIDILNAAPRIDLRDTDTGGTSSAPFPSTCSWVGAGSGAAGAENATCNFNGRDAGVIFNIVGALNGIVLIGDATVADQVQLLTDGTGDGEIVLPAGSIGPGELASGGCQTALSLVIADTADANGTTFNSVAAGTGAQNATETVVDTFIVPVNVVGANLRVLLDTGTGAGTRAYTLRDDAADTTLTCTVGAAANSCTAAGPSAAIAAGSKITVSQVNAGTPTAAAELIISLCLNAQ